MKFFTACFLILMVLVCHPIFSQNVFPGSPAVAGKQILMPYNRAVHSAGKVIRFGNPELENHTLDVALLPDKRYLVLEDRYGIAILDRKQKRLTDRWTFQQDENFRNLMSVFSGVKAFEFQGKTYFAWGAATSGDTTSGILIAQWENGKITTPELLPLPAQAPSPNALPNEIEVHMEGGECYLYVVLNGNEAVSKIRFRDRSLIWSVPTGVAPFGIKIAQNKAFVSNWGGSKPRDPQLETAGVPWGAAYIDPRTGAISKGTVSVYDLSSGQLLSEIQVGLHPNVMALSPDQKMLYVANGNSDLVSVIEVASNKVLRQIPVGLYQEAGGWIGSSPNGLTLDSLGTTLYVSNGLDHAVAVIKLGSQPEIQGFIPTEAYPSGLICVDNTLYVANLEAIGSDVFSQAAANEMEYPQIDSSTFKGAFTSHRQYASLSIIPVPGSRKLACYTKKVKKLGQTRRAYVARALPRPNVAPRPVPERIGEPSVFKHVLYIIKENRTYDQVYGDLSVGRGMSGLCIFGDSVTPNQHKMALQYALLDNYHVSGKSSAEGHQWTDAGIVSDYVQKNVRAWFRSYPHRQYDAMVYTREGFIWNHALDHGKTVKIYGEACFMEFDQSQSWTDIYQKYLKKEPFIFKNTSTISRVRPILSQTFPGYDDAKINDQLRAEAFIRELKAYEAMPGDSLPALMVMALPNDHTAGTSEGYPTPRAMVADNDLALGKIVEAVSKSRFWASTVILVTEDDAQNGWDHRSAYRSGALVISPYSQSKGIVRRYYNQTSMLRTIEQILGLPPMNAIDATAEPMFDCFNSLPQYGAYKALSNRIPLNEMNLSHSLLTGKALYYAQKSSENTQEGIDTGNDDLMNRVLWYDAKGEAPYPKR